MCLWRFESFIPSLSLTPGKRGRFALTDAAKRPRSPALAAAGLAVGDDPDLVQPALRPLACAGQSDAGAGTATVGTGHLRRAGLDRGGAVRHDAGVPARHVFAAVVVTFPRDERAHVCDLRRQAGGVVLQPRCRELSRRDAGASVVPVALLPRTDADEGARRLDQLHELPHAPRGGAGRVRWPLPARWAGLCLAAWIAGRLADGTLLLVHAGQARRGLPRRNPPPALAAAA